MRQVRLGQQAFFQAFCVGKGFQCSPGEGNQQEGNQTQEAG